MPKQIFVIQDTTYNLYCTVYNEILENAGWGNILNAVRWDTQEEVDAAIAAWGNQEGRFIGRNPPPH